MKLRNLQNLRFNESGRFKKLSERIDDRHGLYFWILLIIPSIIIYVSENVEKIYFLIPMLFTAALAPQGLKAPVRLARMKTCSTFLFGLVFVHAIYQNIRYGFKFECLVIDFVGAIVCLIIANADESKAILEKDTEDDESRNKMVTHGISKLSRIYEAMLVVQYIFSSGFLKHQPPFLFGLFFMDVVIRRVWSREYYYKIVRWAVVAFSIVQVIPYCLLKSEYLIQFTLIASIFVICLAISIEILESRLTTPYRNLIDIRKKYLFHNADEMGRFLSKYPNVMFAIDYFWALIYPIPLVAGFWGLANFSVNLSTSFLGIIVVLFSCLIVAPLNWMKARMYTAQSVRTILGFCLMAVLLSEAPSMSRLYKVLLIASLSILSSIVMELYSILDETNRKYNIAAMNGLYDSSEQQLYINSFLRIWRSASPLITITLMLIISLLTIDKKSRLILIGLISATGYFLRSDVKKQALWTFIEIYLIVDQTNILFLSQASLPSDIDTNQKWTVYSNLIMLMMAEIQRISVQQSIFKDEEFASDSKVHSELPSLINANVTDKPKSPDYPKSLLWALIKNFGKIANVASVLALMAVLLFYPQFVDVTIQTCVYSLWAFLFAFLFYRKELTGGIRSIYIGVLTVSSASFIIYNLSLEPTFVLKNLPDLFFENSGYLSQKGYNFLLHGLIFWFSCCSLYANDDSFSREAASEQESDGGDDPSSSPVDSPMGSANVLGVVNKAGSFIERLFVLYWTRSCAFLAFLAASFNPSIFGVIHVLIGCILTWKNILSAKMYVPMIIWLLCSTFLPAVMSKFAPSYAVPYVPLLVGPIRSIESTIFLTLWALILFLQPVFMKCLNKFTSEEDQRNGLVSFQILPQEDMKTEMTQREYESFDNSVRYYASNWFLEFHNEVMIAVLLIGCLSRKNFFGLVYGLLTCFHVLVTVFGNGFGFGALARISFFLQILCFIGEYCLDLAFKNSDILPLKSFYLNFDESSIYGKYFGLGLRSASLIFKSFFVGVYVILTVRWYLTSRYFQIKNPERRFDSHWCRLCDQVSFKSKHSFSRIKYNLHLYLGWIAHAFIFIAAISAFYRPTVPTVLLLIVSLTFFFYGEASILLGKLKNIVYIALAIILIWIISDSVIGALIIFRFHEENKSLLTTDFAIEIMGYFGITSIRKYIRSTQDDFSREAIFDSLDAKVSVGIATFLLLLQIRLYHSKAWPFVIERLYHSYATATRRAALFSRNLQASIEFQQNNLNNAIEHVKNQISVMKAIDISDWRKICNQDGNAKSNESENEDRDSSEPTVRRRSNSKNISELRTHLRKASTSQTNDSNESDHLDKYHSPRVKLLKPLILDERELSTDSLMPSEEDSEREMKELESNFYWYTFVATLQSLALFLLNSCQEYRRLQNRPSCKSTLRILFHHQNYSYRAQFFFQLLFDVLNANFDLLLDALVMDAQVFHSSGFSFLMVIMVLLIGKLQRPYTSKTLHNRILILCAVWIIFNFCKTVLWAHIFELSRVGENRWYLTIKNLDSIRLMSRSLLNRIMGIHITGSIATVTLRPTLILLALSYKRSLMRQLGLWDYGRGMEMARAYYGSEEDLEEFNPESNTKRSQDPSAEVWTLEQLEVEDASSDEIFSVGYSDKNIDEDFEIGSDAPMPDSKPSMLASLKELIWPTVKMPWRDFYIVMFASDFVCMFLMMYYWGDFTLGPDQNGLSRNVSSSSSFFADMINQNMVPAPLVNMIILSSFILVLDRALYVSKNYVGKLTLQLISLIGFHVYIFFHLPQFYLNANFSGFFGIKIWYFFKWIYWISSAMQLRHAYPPLRTEGFLGSSYGIVGATLHNMYRSIPFIEELKTIIDWSMTPSALGIWPWLKLSDIFERLYLVQSARAFQNTYYGRHRFGMPFDRFSKIAQGIMFITLSILIFWSPFLILSRASMMTPNTINSFKLEISIENHGPAFLVFAQDSLHTLNSKSTEYESLRYEEGVNPFEVDPNYFTRVTLPPPSDNRWSISPMARERLLSHLKDKTIPARLKIKWTIWRSRTQAVPRVQGSYSEYLSEADRAQFVQLFDPKLESHKQVFTAKISNVLPYLIKAPLTETSQKLVKAKGVYEIVKICPEIMVVDKPSSASSLKSLMKSKLHDLTLLGSLNSNQITHTHECQYHLVHSGNSNRRSEPIDVFIYSTKLPKYNFSSFNLVGLYATVVFTVAQLLRMMHADMTTRIQYDDLPNPLPLLVLHQQILIMRELGDFESEEAIYWQLIEILRNPQLLIEITRK